MDNILSPPRPIQLVINKFSSLALHDPSVMAIWLVAREGTADDALVHAARTGQDEVVRTLLAPGFGWGVASQWAMNDAALYAVCDGHEETLRMLLDVGGVDVHGFGKVLLDHAVYFGHAGIARLLLEHGVDPVANDNDLLKHAAGRGDLEIARVLLEYGADPCVDDNVLLKNAVHARQYEMLQVLLTRAGPHA